jgi:hypothetical protein
MFELDFNRRIKVELFDLGIPAYVGAMLESSAKPDGTAFKRRFTGSILDRVDMLDLWF